MPKEYALFLSGVFDRIETHDEKPENIERKGVEWVEVSSTRHKYVTDPKKSGWVIEKGKAVCNLVRKSKKVSAIFNTMTEDEISTFLKSLDEKTYIILLTIDELRFDSDFFKETKKKMETMFGAKRTKEILMT